MGANIDPKKKWRWGSIQLWFLQIISNFQDKCIDGQSFVGIISKLSATLIYIININPRVHRRMELVVLMFTNHSPW